MQTQRWAIFVAMWIAICSLRAGADVTYTYTGNELTTIGNEISSADQFTPGSYLTASFTIADDLPENLPDDPNNPGPQKITPLSWSMSDGNHTSSSSSSSSTLLQMSVATDNAGNIINWDMFSSVLLNGFYQDNLWTLHSATVGATFDVSHIQGTPENPGGDSTTNYAENSNSPGRWAVSGTPEDSGGGASPAPLPSPLVGTLVCGALALVGSGRLRSIPLFRKPA